MLRISTIIVNNGYTASEKRYTISRCQLNMFTASTYETS